MEIGEVGLPGQAVKACLAIATDLELDLATIPLLPMEDLLALVPADLISDALVAQVNLKTYLKKNCILF